MAQKGYSCSSLHRRRIRIFCSLTWTARDIHRPQPDLEKDEMRPTIVSLALAIAAAAFLLIYPAHSAFSVSRPTRATLLEVGGQWATVPALRPVVVALVAVTFPHRATRITAAALLGVFALIAGFSIGPFSAPAAVAMAMAAGTGRSGRITG
jgi:hypothetical protein